MNITTLDTFIKTIVEHQTDPLFRVRPNYVRIVPVLWGLAGVGKTYGIKKAATQLLLPVINLRLSQEMAEDMSYPQITKFEGSNKDVLKKIPAEVFPTYKEDMDGNRIKRKKLVNGEVVECENEYQIAFSDISTYIDNYDEVDAYYRSISNGLMTINDAPGGILFLDELNRIEDKGMFQMIFQLLESGRFKGTVLPDEITLFGACNPDTDGYIVAPWFNDPAFANRCVHFRLNFDHTAAFEGLRNSGYSELSLDLVSEEPKLLFDTEKEDFDLPPATTSMRNLSFFDNYVANIDWASTAHPELEFEIFGALYGLGNLARYQSIKEKSAVKLISPLDILTSYDEYDMGPDPYTPFKTRSLIEYEPNTVFDSIFDFEAKSSVRKRLIEARDGDKLDFLNRVIEDLQSFIIKNIDDEETQKLIKDNRLRLLRFSLDLPADLIVSFQKPLFNSEKTFGNNSVTFISLVVDEDDFTSLAYHDCLDKYDKLVAERSKLEL
jgi:hypothetical protein